MTRNGCGAGEDAPTVEDVTDGPGFRRGTMPTISYAIRGQSALMNSWEDPRYFTAALLYRCFPYPLPDWYRRPSRQEDSASIAGGFCRVGLESP
jgi:hypothetical protein